MTPVTALGTCHRAVALSARAAGAPLAGQGSSEPAAFPGWAQQGQTEPAYPGVGVTAALGLQAHPVPSSWSLCSLEKVPQVVPVLQGRSRALGQPCPVGGCGMEQHCRTCSCFLSTVTVGGWMQEHFSWCIKCERGFSFGTPLPLVCRDFTDCLE